MQPLNTTCRLLEPEQQLSFLLLILFGRKKPEILCGVFFAVDSLIMIISDLNLTL